MSVSRNLQLVNQRIASAAERAGRSTDHIQLVAVSKTKPLELVQDAINEGQMVFGENTIQDALTKIPEVTSPGVRWHFIGHLQSKKARSIPGNFHWVHSLDSLKLAKKLSTAYQAVRKQTPELENLNVLIQVNVSRDPNKSGVATEQLLPFVEELLENDLACINLRGLMTIGVQGANESELRTCFAQLCKLRDDCAQNFALPEFTELSMGMSNDFESAIAEGATMVRIGSRIFGSR